MSSLTVVVNHGLMIRLENTNTMENDPLLYSLDDTLGSPSLYKWTKLLLRLCAMHWTLLKADPFCVGANVCVCDVTTFTLTSFSSLQS